MPLNIQNLDELDPDLVEQLQAEFEELVRERHPEIAMQRGVFHDLIAHFSGGISGAANQTAMNRLLQAGSLLDIEANPELADDYLVDRVMSNYRIERNAGELAQGEITIRVSADVATVVPANLVFQANGLDFAADNAYTALPTGSTPIIETDRVLTAVGDGTYSFTINGVATAVGQEYNIRRGTTMTPVSFPPNFVNSVAATDFQGGQDVELNSELLARLQEGVAAKVMQGRTNISALIKEQQAFKNTLAYSVVGYGNAEMLRDQHTIFPVSMGGRLDIYARTDALPRRAALLRQATLVADTIDGGVWQVALGRDDAAGLYDVVQVILPEDPPDTASFEITEEIWGFDMTDDGNPIRPDLISVTEAAFTKYQTRIVRFLDTATPTAGLMPGVSRKEYSVTLRSMPLVKELQDFCLNYNWRNLASDVAVKAAVPCFLSINFEIQQAAGSLAPDTEAIKNALVSEINSLGFPGQLHASLVSDVAHEFLKDRQAVGGLSLHGKILRPTGAFQVIRSNDVLRIPNDPGNMVSGRTTSFILEPDDIGISLVTEGFTVGV